MTIPRHAARPIVFGLLVALGGGTTLWGLGAEWWLPASVLAGLLSALIEALWPTANPLRR